ncbi:uncharacterized protein LOC106419322 isoform X1 [Brassica napus]|nr:uncharacterized protein LOC106419322 isoform X1 [Brassica napus]
MGTIDVPIFYGEGDDLMEWMCWINDFAYDQSFTDYETLQFAYSFIEGDALRWYRDESSRSVFRSWANLKYRLVMRFCKRPTQLEVTNLQERLRQISRMLDRWDEEDEAKKQQEEEMMAVGDSNQTLSSVEGSVKSFESAPPVTVSEEGEEVLPEMITEEDPLTEKMETAWVEPEMAGVVRFCEKTRRGDDPIELVGKLFQTFPFAEWRSETRKKKKRWKASMKLQGSLEEELSEQKVSNDVKVEHDHKVFDQITVRRNGYLMKKKTRWKASLEGHRPLGKSLGGDKKSKSVCQEVVKLQLRYKKRKRIKQELVFAQLRCEGNKTARWQKHKFKQKKKVREGFSKNQLQGTMMMMLAAKLKKKPKLEYQSVVYRRLLLLVTAVWTEALTEGKKGKNRYKYLNCQTSWKQIKQQGKRAKIREKHIKSKWKLRVNREGKRDELFLQLLLSTVRTKREYKHVLEAGELLQGRKRALKKLANRMRHKLVWRKMEKRVKHKFKQKEPKELIMLEGPVMLLTANARKRSTSKGKHVGIVKNFVLLGIIWARVNTKWRKAKVKHKFQNMHKTKAKAQVIQIVLFEWVQLMGMAILNRKKITMEQIDNTYRESQRRPLRYQVVKRKKNEKHDKDRRWKYKPLKGNHLKLQSRMRRNLKYHSLGRIEDIKRLKYGCVEQEELLLWEIGKKESKSQEKTKARSYQVIYVDIPTVISIEKRSTEVKIAIYLRLWTRATRESKMIQYFCFALMCICENQIRDRAKSLLTGVVYEKLLLVVGLKLNCRQVAVMKIQWLRRTGSSVQWQKKPKEVYAMKIVDKALYFTQEMYQSPRPPERNQKEVCCSGCRQELVQVKRLCCLYNLEEINFPHDPGDTLKEKGVKSIMAVYIGLYQNWRSDRRMIKKDTAGQPGKLYERAISHVRGPEQIGLQSLSKDTHFFSTGHSYSIINNLEDKVIFKGRGNVTWPIYVRGQLD